MKAFIILSKHMLKRKQLFNCYTNGNKSLVNKWLVSNRCYATAVVQTDPPITPPPVSADDKQYAEKIHKIVNDISSLTLIEVTELNQLLKKTLNISDTPVMAFGAMPVAGRPEEEEDEDLSAKTVQTSFTLKLNKFDDTKKVALIKEVKNVIEGMNLVQAKKFVESVPQIIKANILKEEADKLKAALEAAGGQCDIE